MQPARAPTTVLLDSYHNNETKDPGHYQWGTTSAYGMLSVTSTRAPSAIFWARKPARWKQPVSRATLAGAKRSSSLSISDTPEESDTPKYIQPSESAALDQWVREGGRLVLLANDKGNAEFPISTNWQQSSELSL